MFVLFYASTVCLIFIHESHRNEDKTGIEFMLSWRNHDMCLHHILKRKLKKFFFF